MKTFLILGSMLMAAPVLAVDFLQWQIEIDPAPAAADATCPDNGGRTCSGRKVGSQCVTPWHDRGTCELSGGSCSCV